MATYTITGDDTLTLNNRVFTDFATDDFSTITFDNNLSELKTGKNQNTIFAKNETGNNATLNIRLMKGSSDDRYLQGIISADERDYVGSGLINGEFVKRLGDGESNIIREVATLLGGKIQKKVPTKGNSSGDIEQGVSVYVVMFANGKISIQ